MMAAELDGRLALVTGSRRGIGRTIAQTLAARGALVVVHDRTLDGLEEVTRDITVAGGRALARAADLTRPEEVQRMLRELEASLGPVSILVNNAALISPETVAADRDVLETDLGLWKDVFQVNLCGAVTTTRCVLPGMLERGQGCVINIGSLLGVMPLPGAQVVYSCSKAALDMLTRHVAVTFGKRGIRCNMIAPGSILTEAQRAVFSAEELERKLAAYPSPRLGEARDIAEVAAFLASDRAAFINGQVLGVDGGVSRRLVL